MSPTDQPIGENVSTHVEIGPSRWTGIDQRAAEGGGRRG
jgi:hypothetical protein